MIDDKVLQQLPEYMHELAVHGEPAKPADRPSGLQMYALLFVTIDGQLQSQEQSVDVRHGADKVRVYVRWACPASGLEWDGSESVGSTRQFRVCVIGTGGEAVVDRNMRCTWFAVSHAVNDCATARAIFECDREPAAS